MAKKNPLKNNMVIDRLNEVQKLRNALEMQSMDSVEICTMVVKKRFGEFMRYNEIDAICLYNLLNAYKESLLQECAGKGLIF